MTIVSKGGKTSERELGIGRAQAEYPTENLGYTTGAVEITRKRIRRQPKTAQRTGHAKIPRED